MRFVNEIGNLPSKLLLKRDKNSGCLRFPREEGVSPQKGLLLRLKKKKRRDLQGFLMQMEVDCGNCWMREREREREREKES